jgi:uroporphyrinogen decarboxylase
MSGAYETASTANREKIDKLLADTAAYGGLAPVDLEQFWHDQALAKADPFGTDIPQVAFGAICNHECVFDELGVEEDRLRYFFDDPEWALDLHKQYNDKAEKIVGRRLLSEAPRQPNTPQLPPVKQLHDIFEAQNVWEGGKLGSWWLRQSADSPEELAALLDRVEKRLENLRDFILPENWGTELPRFLAAGKKVPLYRGQRGPCTFACSIYGAENLLFLSYDDPDLFARFSDVLKRAILGRAKVLDEEAGLTPEAAQGRWSWADDNCCLFTPDMYETFAMPIHRAVFSTYAPRPEHHRYQHSDSDMAHLLPLLAEVDLKGTNFGPTLTVSEIRQHCPHAVIDGQMAPFTYSRNEEANMLAEFLRDFDQAREKRGLNFTTAGSINNGSRLSGMRLLMAVIQRYGRYK